MIWARRAGLSVATLQAGVSSLEATEWLASARLDPDEEERADIRHALLSDLLVRLLWRPARRGQKLPLDTDDFLAALPWREEHKATRATSGPTPADLVMKINAAMRALGGSKRGR